MAKELIRSDTSIAAAAKRGDRRLSDGGGLYLLFAVKGASHGWRFDYSFGGLRKTLSLGTYPDTGLQAARRKAGEFRKLVADEIDPSVMRQGAKKKRADDEAAKVSERKRLETGEPLPGSFKAIALDWFERIHRPKVSPGHAERTLTRLRKDVFPYIGDEPLCDLGAATRPLREEGMRKLLDVLLRIEMRGVRETAHRVRDACGQVFRYGIRTGHCDRDPAADLREALQPVNADHLAAITEPKRVGELMRAIDEYTGQPVTRAALRFAALVFQRPGNVREAEWSEIDLDGATWTIPSAKMKRLKKDKLNGKPHLVPLSRQAVELLLELHPLTGYSVRVFPSTRGDGKPMSDATLNSALKRMDFSTKEMTSHGFRAMARTLLHENGIDPHVIEAQLAHAVPDALGRAYNRTQFLDQRIEMMQKWADYLDTLRHGARVVTLKEHRAAR